MPDLLADKRVHEPKREQESVHDLAKCITNNSELRHGRQPEENISRARTVVSLRFLY